jgi:hypothetical protein
MAKTSTTRSAGRGRPEGAIPAGAGVVPPEIAKKLPRYPLIPATLEGRLAVDERHYGEGIGEFLLMNAPRRMHYIVPGAIRPNRGCGGCVRGH